MQRCVYRAQCAAGADERAVQYLKGRAPAFKDLVKNEGIMTLSIFEWGQNIFVYYECIDKFISPGELFGDMEGLLLKWPGESELRCWIPMMDIYHCCEPVDKDYWKRRQPVKRAFARVNRLRPGMLASYIFYHYQYQEERPGDWAKYASIHLNENLMFFYQEEPDGPENTPYRGRLDTANTPGQWEDLMKLHFLPWEDDPQQLRPWREIEQVLFI